MTEQRLAEIEARAKAATEGPWIESEMQVAAVTRGVIAVIPTPRVGGVFDCQQNKAFIAHAREDIPYLLTTLRAAEAREARLREALTERIDYHDHHGSMAEGADMPESAAHHDAIRKELETIRAELEQKP